MRGTREVWSKRVARWKRSGLTAKAFAAREGLKTGTLTFWSWRFRADARRAAREKGRKPEAVRFVEVSPPIFASSPRFEIEVGSCRVLVAPSFEAEALRRLLDVLRAQP